MGSPPGERNLEVFRLRLVEGYRSKQPVNKSASEPSASDKCSPPTSASVDTTGRQSPQTIRQAAYEPDRHRVARP